MYMENDGRQTVLIVDDSLLICNQIRLALKEEDINICEAHTGQEAVEQIKQHQPDLILLDVVLPDADGYELYGTLKEADQKNAVIIFLTSKSSDEDVVRGFSVGACDYIKKPFVKAELQSRIHAHLLQKKQKDELDRQNRELRNSMEKLNYMAYRDGLTGLYNRRYVVGDLLEDMRSCGKEAVETVFAMVDIDDFKRVNDTYGHDAGDMALVCIAISWKATAANTGWSAGAGRNSSSSCSMSRWMRHLTSVKESAGRWNSLWSLMEKSGFPAP